MISPIKHVGDTDLRRILVPSQELTKKLERAPVLARSTWRILITTQKPGWLIRPWLFGISRSLTGLGRQPSLVSRPSPRMCLIT